MKVGTKSLLFGAHQFVLHPLFLALAWHRLYGFPSDPRLWIAFIVHDWGYWGRENMDGDEGQRHPELGGRIMAALFGEAWGDFTRLHSRYYAKREGREPSRLCAADKLVLLVTPRWIYLPLVRATGEVNEYLALYAQWRGVETVTIDEWYDGLRAHWHDEVLRLAPHTRYAQESERTMSDKAQLQALGTHLSRRPAIQVIYDNDGVAHVKLHETLYSPEALVQAAAVAARYSAALATIADAHPFDVQAFARAVLAGKSVDEALAADVAEMNRPNTAEKQEAWARSLTIMNAQHGIVQLALRWEEADPFDEPALRLIEETFWGHVKAFRDAVRKIPG